MIVGILALSPHRDRLEGFRKAMQEANLPIRDEYLVQGDVQIQSGFDATQKLLGLEPRPSAVMASNNKLLLGLLQALEENKMKVPQEMSVLGFDDYAWNKYLSPSVTAIAQPTYEMGRQAFGLLHQLMNRDEATDSLSKHLRLAAELRVRNSTAGIAHSLALFLGKIVKKHSAFKNRNVSIGAFTPIRIHCSVRSDFYAYYEQ